LAHLLYGVQGGGGFVVLTGEIGAGKTTVCRHFLEHAPAQCRVAYIFNPRLTVSDLLATICHEFGVLAPAGQLTESGSTKAWLDALNAHLLAAHAQGLNNVLVIDEAQNLPADVLEQLRLLTNLETSERKLLQIVLIGQPDLRTLLARPELEQLAQRVIARYHLGALTTAETSHYIEHRLRVAGLTGPLPFSPDALARVHTISRGIPRRINLLCDRALLGAYAQGHQQVKSDTVDQAAAEVFDASVAAPPLAARARHRAWAAGLAGALVGVGLTVLSGWMAWERLQTPASVSAASVFPASGPPAQPLTPSLPNPPPTNPVEASNSTATATAAGNGPPEASAPTMAAPMEQTAPDWTALHTSEASALAELAGVWALPSLADEPCASAQLQQHQCYRMPRMTLDGVQAFDRPAVLRLHPPGAPAGYAVLTQWAADRVTFVAQGRPWSLPVDALGSLWRGEYAAYWRTPVRVKKHITSGFDPLVMPWLEASLLRLQQQGALPPEADGLRERIKAFQRTNGLGVTGQAGPTTLILINRAIGVEEPRLQTGVPLAPSPR
jgi:general secretion pathway protein A